MMGFFNSPTVHAFQSRTVDRVIAAMEAGHPHLTTLKSFYVEISRARDSAELVTDDRAALKERIEAATGERIAALQALGSEAEKAHGRHRPAVPQAGREPARERVPEPSRAPKIADREMGL